MPRLCKLCVHPDQDAVRSALASGATDRAIGRQFGLTHVSVGRHRREHVVRPMQAAARALDKGRGAREQRQQLVARAEEGDPTTIFALSAIAADLTRIARRLDASAEEAAAGRQHTAHASLASQLLRQAEIRARIGGHDKATPSSSQGQLFRINIVFSGGRTESIKTRSQGLGSPDPDGELARIERPLIDFVPEEDMDERS
jgi:hypothetical protein